MSGIYELTPPTLPDKARRPLLLDSAGNVKVVVGAAGTSTVTEYTEDAAAAANPTGPMMMAVRRDTLTAAEVTTDGDNIALKATSLGQLHTLASPIAGQTGVTAGAGAVAANTPRVTLASDDPVTTALQIMDDWDESDRAKVNLIASQAGVAGGQGAISANTIRTVPAALEYEVVAAADTDEPIGAAGDYISHVTFMPATTAAGSSNVKDGSTTLFSYTAGTLADLKPIHVPLGIIAVSGVTVTTGTNMTATVYGNFA